MTPEDLIVENMFLFFRLKKSIKAVILIDGDTVRYALRESRLSKDVLDTLRKYISGGGLG